MANLESVTSKSMEQYRSFARECRHLVTQEIVTGRYANLKNSYTAGIKKVPLAEYKAVVHIIGRPPDLEHNGRRDMEVGRLETVAVVEAPLKDPADYKKGFELQQVPEWIRIVIGQNISHDEIIDNVKLELNARKTEIAGNLSSGNYHAFVINILTLVDNAIGSFKVRYDLIPSPVSLKQE